MVIQTVKPPFGIHNDIVENFECYSQLRDIIVNSKDSFILDLSDIKWIAPSYIIPIISLLKNNKQKIHSIIYPCKDTIYRYLKTIKFPDGIDVSNLKCDSTYLPVLEMSKVANEKELNNLFSILDKNIAKEQTASLKYILSELTDNIYQHSNFKSSFVMAQVYKHKNEVEIAICDDGIGISGSYKKYEIPYQNDADAILKAYKGISSKKIEGRGYGIGSSAKISIEGFKGDLLIVSNYGGLIQNPNKLKISSKYSFRGTCICIRFKFPKIPIDIYKYIDY